MDEAWRAGRGAQFYRSTPPRRAFLGPIGDFITHAKTGKLRVLALSGQDRSPFLPAAPTLREQGYPLAVREWYGFCLEIRASSPGELAERFKADAAEWRDLIRQTGYTAES